MTFKFTVPGKPQPKQRPRFTYSGMTYTPKETVAYEKSVRKAYEECGGTMFKGAVSASVRCFFEIPQSYTKKRRAACEINEERPIGKNLGDCDNLAKSVLDSLNGIAFKDDSRVVDLEVRKLWGSPARTEVILSEGPNRRCQHLQALCRYIRRKALRSAGVQAIARTLRGE